MRFLTGLMNHSNTLAS